MGPAIVMIALALVLGYFFWESKVIGTAIQFVVVVGIRAAEIFFWGTLFAAAMKIAYESCH